jgi:hypothetical protein
MEVFVLLFCKSFDRHGYVLTKPVGVIIAVSDPDRSDFKFSRERWVLTAEGDGTRMIYEFEMEPAFWVPPVIGPFYIKRALRDGGARAVQRIEVLALADAKEFEEREKKVVQSGREQ